MGQVTPFVALMIAMVAGALILVSHLGGAAADRARARTAADAAALAGAVGGDDAARRVAVANGSSLIAVARSGYETEVTVEVNQARATARARLSWSLGRPGAPS